MARKKEQKVIDQSALAPSESDKVRQQIANLCTSIGDRSFVIRQAESDITQYYGQIDALREQLRTLETPAEAQKA